MARDSIPSRSPLPGTPGTPGARPQDGRFSPPQVGSSGPVCPAIGRVLYVVFYSVIMNPAPMAPPFCRFALVGNSRGLGLCLGSGCERKNIK